MITERELDASLKRMGLHLSPTKGPRFTLFKMLNPPSVSQLRQIGHTSPVGPLAHIRRTAPDGPSAASAVARYFETGALPMDNQEAAVKEEVARQLAAVLEGRGRIEEDTAREGEDVSRKDPPEAGEGTPRKADEPAAKGTKGRAASPMDD